jgi:hypothetical protein
MFKVLHLNLGPHNFLVVTLLMIAAFAIVIIGCSNDNSGTNEGQNSMEITPLDGGTFSFGQGHVNFPPGSVEDLVSISSEAVSLEGIPVHVAPLTDVHKINLSDPDQYNSRTATLKFILQESIDGANIYHSKDGVNWENLVGDIDGNTISTKIYSFSYFFVGSIRESISVDFVNKSSISGNVCIFQTNSDSSGYYQYSTAWLVRSSSPETQVTFNWSIDYEFVWSSIGSLEPGTIFAASQIVNAGLTSIPVNEFNSLLQENCYLQ